MNTSKEIGLKIGKKFEHFSPQVKLNHCESQVQKLIMWNGKINNLSKDPAGSAVNLAPMNLNIRNNIGQTNDTVSVRSISSEDVSTSDLPTTCCNSNATNPAIKSGRRFQLLQVFSFLNSFLLVLCISMIDLASGEFCISNVQCPILLKKILFQ